MIRRGATATAVRTTAPDALELRCEAGSADRGGLPAGSSAILAQSHPRPIRPLGGAPWTGSRNSRQLIDSPGATVGTPGRKLK